MTVLPAAKYTVKFDTPPSILLSGLSAAFYQIGFADVVGIFECGDIGLPNDDASLVTRGRIVSADTFT
jgi:hypothetical protein